LYKEKLQNIIFENFLLKKITLNDLVKLNESLKNISEEKSFNIFLEGKVNILIKTLSNQLKILKKTNPTSSEIKVIEKKILDAKAKKAAIYARAIKPIKSKAKKASIAVGASLAIAGPAGYYMSVKN
jgi:hypothetical protein